MAEKILVINPGSTSTKIAFFDGETNLFSETINHPTEEIQKYARIIEQKDFRKEVILKTIRVNEHKLEQLDAISARGGLLKPIPGGTWQVNEKMVQDLEAARNGEHASNLGAVLALEIAGEYGCPSYIVDPVIVDEMEDVARISGMPELPRLSIFHALNQKAVAREVAAELGKDYQNVTFIVAHMGGGVSVGLHHFGRVIDVNNALDGEGPFSAERSGGLPVGDLVRLCFSGRYTKEQLERKIKGEGGLVAYLGTSSLLEVEQRVERGEEKAKEVLAAMAYQIAKEIGFLAPVVRGKVDRIILTGGMAKCPLLVNQIKARVEFLALVTVKPGEREMEALARGALRVLSNEEEPGIYD